MSAVEYKTVELKSSYEIVEPDLVLEASGFHSFRRGSIPEPDDDYESKMTDKERKFMQEHIYVDEQTKLAISKEPQGSEKWKKFRGKRVTTSKFDSIVGDNPYQTPEECLEEIICPTFVGNQNTEYGTAAEPVAREDFIRGERKILRDLVNAALKNHQTYVVYLDRILHLPSKFLQPNYVITNEDLLTIEVRGLVVDNDEPWMAGSSDGELIIFGIYRWTMCEFKCPVRKQLYELMKIYYYNQAIGNMKIHKLEVCLWVCWTDAGYSRTIIEFDPIYWDGFLRPKLRHFYFKMLLPRLANQTQQDIRKMLQKQAALAEAKSGTKRKRDDGAEKKSKRKKAKTDKASVKKKRKMEDDDDKKPKKKKAKTVNGKDEKSS